MWNGIKSLYFRFWVRTYSFENRTCENFKILLGNMVWVVMLEAYYSRIITFVNDNLVDYGKAYLVVDNGRVREIKKEKPQMRIVDYEDFLILPGFIDTHTHLAQIDVRAKWCPDLLDWLEKYVFEAEMKFNDLEYARIKAEEFFMELKKNGTTTAAVYAPPYVKATDIAFERAMESGLRIIMGQTLMDMNAPKEILVDSQRAMRDIIYLAEKWNGVRKLLYYAVTPRFAITCSDKLLKAIGNISRERNLYVQSHIGEQEREVREALELHPNHASYADIYFTGNLLGPKSILAHAIYLSERDLNILKLTDTRIAHCPSSNFFLHSGIMNIKKLKDLRLKIGFGSDVAAGPYFSMLQVARDASYANSISPEEAFYYITLGGAETLGLSSMTGSLERDKFADFVVVDVSDFVNEDVNTREILSGLIYRGDDRNIIATYIAGKEVYKQEDKSF